MSDSVRDLVIEKLGSLPEELQRRVLEFMQTLQADTVQPVPGTRLLRFAGAIAQDDLDLMRRAIDNECERVDTHDW